jgi:Ser/Thr protein kinase RdoA (MazF antagonist)
VSEFNDRLDHLPPELRAQRYQRLAEAALARYAIGDAVTTFVAHHNGGVLYHAQTTNGQRYALKVLAPRSAADAPTPQGIRSVLLWLAALARQTDLVIQEPVADRSGELLCAVAYPDLREPFRCSLQRWVEGEHAGGDVRQAQAYQVGVLLGRLHQHGSQWVPSVVVEAQEFDEAWLADQAQALFMVVGLGVVSAAEWTTLEAAQRLISDQMRALGRERAVWGPIHGDLHQDNVLFCGGEAQAIDFDRLYRAHFAFDVGVSLYHLLYLPGAAGAETRRALLDGYRSIRALDLASGVGLEAFICAAALANLAFQASLPEERSSPRFASNVRDLVTNYCRKLVVGEPFACR